MTEYATGGPVDPGRTYWLGEHGPEPLVVPESSFGVRPIDLSKYGSDATFTLDNSDAVLETIRGLKDSSITVSGYFDADLTMWKTMQRFQPVAVSIEVPASRWQAFKRKMRRIPGLGWLPVRMAWKRQFVGRVEAWPNGNGFTISTNPEETTP